MSEETQTPPFVTGFGLGLLAGAAGFVLFGTKRGAQLRGELQKAFIAAYQEELAAGEVAGQSISLRDFLTTAFKKVKEEVALDALEGKSHASSHKSTKTKSKTARPKSTDAKTKFKNL